MLPIEREIAKIVYEAYFNNEVMLETDISNKLEARGFNPEKYRDLIRQYLTTSNRTDGDFDQDDETV